MATLSDSDEAAFWRVVGALEQSDAATPVPLPSVQTSMFFMLSRGLNPTAIAVKPGITDISCTKIIKWNDDQQRYEEAYIGSVNLDGYRPLSARDARDKYGRIYAYAVWTWKE